ncbi:MAG TPA: rhomboid family intramembrane serine protease [Pyrinomonadaceae bacterium]|nr:rhomboid family intramembrane serine protease [Pyrinomonadaceae bacterium]
MEAATGQLPWDGPEAFPEKPDDGAEYGYVLSDSHHGCSREILEERSAEVNAWGSPTVVRVWTPESPYLVLPEEVPWLHDAVRKRNRRTGLRGLIWSVVFLLVFSPLLLFADSKLFRIFLVFYYLPIFVSAAASVRAMFKSPSLKPEEVRREAEASRYEAWVVTRPITYTKWLCGFVVAAGVCQAAGLENSINAAGLVKDAVWRGQWWRLFTCSMLHVSFMHFWMNFLALRGLGRLVEAHASRWHLPVVFLVSVLTGSLASLLLLPSTTSAGASGGLMGLIGFLGAAGYRHREHLPRSFLRGILLNVLFVGLIGVVGFDFIDNAAHAGGLLGGAATGLVLVRGRAGAYGSEPPRWLRRAGVAALSLLLLVTATTIWAILKTTIRP